MVYDKGVKLAVGNAGSPFTPFRVLVCSRSAEVEASRTEKQEFFLGFVSLTTELGVDRVLRWLGATAWMKASCGHLLAA